MELPKTDIKQAVAVLQEYMNTYQDQPEYERYMTVTLVNDVIYGLGLAIDENRFSGHAGFTEFRRVLAEHLKT